MAVKANRRRKVSAGAKGKKRVGYIFGCVAFCAFSIFAANVFYLYRQRFGEYLVAAALPSDKVAGVVKNPVYKSKVLNHSVPQKRRAKNGIKGPKVLKANFHNNKNNVKHVPKKVNSPKFSRHKAIAKELHKLEEHLHMVSKSYGSKSSPHKNRAVVARKKKEQVPREALLRNIETISFEEVSSSAKAATKNAMTPEERVLRLCTEKVSNTLIKGGNEVEIKKHNVRLPDTLRVMQYNVYDGIKNERRKNWIGEYVQNSKVDVLTLNELNDWNEKIMKETAIKWGFKYSQIMVTGEYNIGIMSQYSITTLSYQKGGTFHHGFLHVRINHPNTPFRVIVTHLSPWESKKRILEVEALLMVAEGARMPTHTIFVKIHDGPRVPITLPDMEKTHIKSIMDVLYQTWNEEREKIGEEEKWALYNGNQQMLPQKTLLEYNICDGDELYYQNINAHITHGDVPSDRKCSSDALHPYSGDEPLLVMGDLNSLSKLDSKSYDESKLLKHIRGMRVKDTKDRLTKKFLKPSLNFREKYTIDYGAIEMFLNFGYVDFLGEANLKSKSFHHTVPTMLQVDYMHAQRMRLDYIIGNREFSKKYGSCVNAHTMQSACSEILSDHLPILLTFKTNIGGNGGRSANNKKETLLKKFGAMNTAKWKTS